MRIYIIIILSLFSTSVFSQGYFPIGATRPQDTSKNVANMLINGGVRIPSYHNSDTNSFLSTDAWGNILLRRASGSGGGAVSSVYGRVGAVVATAGDYTTTLIPEGTRLYFTDARVFADTGVFLNYIKALDAQKLKITDTLNKWQYKLGFLPYTPTQVDNLVNARVLYTDTSGLLLPYLRKYNASLLYQPIGNYLNQSDSTTYSTVYRNDTGNRNLRNYIATIPTSADSTRFSTIYRNDTGNRNLRNYIATIPTSADSTVFQTKYRSDTGRNNVYNYIGANQALNLKYTDSSAMLAPYMRKGDSSTYFTKYRSDTMRTAIYNYIGIKGSGTITTVTSPNSSITISNPTTTPAIDIDPTHSNTFTASQTIQRNALGTTPTAGLTLQNLTAATVGIPYQYSPYTYQKFGMLDVGLNPVTGGVRQGVTPFSGGGRYKWTFDGSSDAITYTTFLSFRESGAATFNSDVTATGNLAAANFSGSSSGTNTGDQTISLTGDVTGSGTGSFSTSLTSVVVAGSCSLCTVTYDAKGRITATSSGSGGGITSITAIAPLAQSGGSTPTVSVTAIPATSVLANTTGGSASPSGNVVYGSAAAASSLVQLNTHKTAFAYNFNSSMVAYQVPSTTVTFTVDSPSLHLFLNSGTNGTLTVQLPDVTTLPLGTIYDVYSEATNTTTYQISTGTQIFSSTMARETGSYRFISASTTSNVIGSWKCSPLPLFTSGGNSYPLGSLWGGTGKVGYVAGSILIGPSGNNTIAQTAVGQVGQILVGSGTGNQPSWSNSPSHVLTTLTDAATIAFDLSLGTDYQVQLGGSRTMGVPTNIIQGIEGYIRVVQDVTGSRLLTWPWPYTSASNTFPVLSLTKFSSDILRYKVMKYSTSTATMTIATPCVVSWTAHGLMEGQEIQFTTTGALPTGVTANTTYFVHSTGANTFNLATSFANLGTATYVASSGTQSGTHTAVAASVSINMYSKDDR